MALDADDNLADDVEAVSKAAWADLEDGPDAVCGVCDEQDENVVDTPSCGSQCADGAQEAKGLPDVKAPTKAEEHMLTHLPYNICVNVVCGLASPICPHWKMHPFSRTTPLLVMD